MDRFHCLILASTQTKLSVGLYSAFHHPNFSRLRFFRGYRSGGLSRSRDSDKLSEWRLAGENVLDPIPKSEERTSRVGDCSKHLAWPGHRRLRDHPNEIH